MTPPNVRLPALQPSQAAQVEDVDVVSRDVQLPKGMGSVTQVSPGKISVEFHGGPEIMRPLGGSDTPQFNTVMLHSVIGAMADPDDGQGAARVAAAAAVLTAFKPIDEIEGMLAAQAAALHFGAMECLRRAVLPKQAPEIASKLRKDGANLARAMTDMLDALDRKRGKGPQVVRVERVVVHEGGQAVVGNMTASGQEGAGG